MKERPILFSGAMVRAILAGQKTQTRRVLKPQPVRGPSIDGDTIWRGGQATCPYGQPGDRLWVREAHAIFGAHGQHRSDGKRWGPWGGLPTVLSPDRTQIAYFREGFDRCTSHHWRPSIHMPRWASRLTLAVESIRVERLQDISEEDARAEGVEPCSAWLEVRTCHTTGAAHRCAFKRLWAEINGKRPGCSWKANPWVWVVGFKVAEVRR